MSSAAQIDLEPLEQTLHQLPASLQAAHPSAHVSSAPAAALPPSSDAFVLREQVAERLAAHRSRRSGARPSTAPAPAASAPRARTSRIAAAVAERYANSPSYRAFLAAEAASAIDQAQAAAEVAAVTAQAVAEAQYSLLAELDLLAAPAEASSPAPIEVSPAASREAAPEPSSAQDLPAFAPAFEAVAPRVSLASGITIRLYEEPRLPALPVRFADNSVDLHGPLDEEEGLALDEEIAFRQSPVFDESSSRPVPLPANLIEFPRQLVAARKARPRLAEGPLRDEAEPLHDPSQLRIFEVESGQISTVAELTPDSAAWGSIVLSSQPVEPVSLPDDLPGLSRPDSAPIPLRLRAAAIDTAAVFFAAALFFAAFLYTAGPISRGSFPLPIAAAAVAATLLLLGLVYLLVCFTFSDATAGMRLSRIALCDFHDESPRRRARLLRIAAFVLSAAPLGAGLLWAWLDADSLGWHDRISRCYQRSY